MARFNPFLAAGVAAAFAMAGATSASAQTGSPVTPGATTPPIPGGARDVREGAVKDNATPATPSTRPGASASRSSRQSGSSGGGSKQSQASAAPPPGAPLIVLVPVAVASNDNALGNGCWARLYDDENFRGNQLSLVGPVDMPNMRTAFGTDWSGTFQSIAVGPKATVTVYDNENYREKAATFKPGQKVGDLDRKMGFFEQIRSVKIACGGSTPTAQRGGTAGGASAGASGSSASRPSSTGGSSGSGSVAAPQGATTPPNPGGRLDVREGAVKDNADPNRR